VLFLNKYNQITVYSYKLYDLPKWEVNEDRYLHNGGNAMMKRIILLCVLVFFVSSVIVAYGHSQTIEEIRAKMIEAQGGKSALESIKDRTMTGDIEIVQQGLSGTLTIYKKEPDKRRADIEIMGMVITQAYDGQMAWFTNPQTGSSEEVTGDQADIMKRQALPSAASLNPGKYGIKWAYKGKETVDGKDCFVLEQTFDDGLTVTHYVDSKTHLTYKSRSMMTNQMGVEVETEQVYSDFKKVGGVVMAHSITSYQDGEEYTVISFSEVRFNTGLEDSLFKME
jgi:outer membrane lipoprotein-sorting protein